MGGGGSGWERCLMLGGEGDRVEGGRRRWEIKRVGVTGAGGWGMFYQATSLFGGGNGTFLVRNPAASCPSMQYLRKGKAKGKITAGVT